MKSRCNAFLLFALLFFSLSYGSEGYSPEWAMSASIVIGTTDDWVYIPDSVTVLNFPLLIRLDSGSFNFSEAKPRGEDIRFYKNRSVLAHEIEYWNPVAGEAAIWVKIDTIKGNSIQTINMYWGLSGISGLNNSAVIFDTGIGFTGVWHLGESTDTIIHDATYNNFHGRKKSLNEPVPVDGMVGYGQRFDGEDDFIDLGHVSGRDYLNSAVSVTQTAWVKIGHVAPQNQGVLQLSKWGDGEKNSASRACLEVSTENRFMVYARAPDEESAQTATSSTLLNVGVWYHLAGVINYSKNVIQLFVNGELDTVVTTAFKATSVDSTHTRSGAIGAGDNPTYDYYKGVVDEVRNSKTARSPWWIKLSYQNQNFVPALVSYPIVKGCLKQFKTSDTLITISEGEISYVNGVATCAFLARWSKLAGQTYVPVLMNGTNLTIGDVRVRGDSSFHYKFSALYESEDASDTVWKDIKVTVNVRERIPEPDFTLTADSSWDGTIPLVLRPVIKNLDSIKGCRDSVISYSWNTSGVSVNTENEGDSLVLRDAYGDGLLKVELCLDNGFAVCKTVMVSVKRKLSVRAAFPTRKELIFCITGQEKKILIVNRGYEKVEITDVYGRLIQEFPVSSTLVWDGRNRVGQKTVSGMYVVRFLGKHKSASYKILLAR